MHVFPLPLSCKNRPGVWNTSLPTDEEPTQPVLGFRPGVRISFPDSGSMCAPLFYLRVRQRPPGTAPVCFSDSVGQGERSFCRSRTEVHRGQLPYSGCRGTHSPWGTNAHCWRWSCSVSSLCKKSIVPSSASSVTPIPRCSGQKCFTSVPGGWHWDDFHYHPCGWSSSLHWLMVQSYSTSCMNRSLRLQHNSSCTAYSLSIRANGFLRTVPEEDMCVTHESPHLSTAEEALSDQMGKMTHSVMSVSLSFLTGPMNKVAAEAMHGLHHTDPPSFPGNELAKCD